MTQEPPGVPPQETAENLGGHRWLWRPISSQKPEASWLRNSRRRIWSKTVIDLGITISKVSQNNMGLTIESWFCWITIEYRLNLSMWWMICFFFFSRVCRLTIEKRSICSPHVVSQRFHPYCKVLDLAEKIGIQES